MSIATELERIQQAKQDIVDALKTKGITISSNSTIDEFPQYINTYYYEYLTFTATNSGTFKFSGNSVSYSLDSGSTWTSLSSNTNSPTVSAGSKIMWKATLTPTSSIGIGTFSSTNSFIVEGNAMSLLYGDDFVGQIDLTGKDYAFGWIFSGCTGMTSAENLMLPATTLASTCYYNMFKDCTYLTAAPDLPATTLTTSCYYGMFRGCTSLTTTPELSATVLTEGCYYGMFDGCTSLNEITCFATNISANNCTTYWVRGVSKGGVFKKAKNMLSWTTGINGIPSKWSVTPNSTYLQSDGNAFINTNLPYDSTDNTYVVECRFSQPSYVSSFDAVFGAYTDENSKCLRIIRGAKNTLMWTYYNNKAGGGVSVSLATNNTNIKETIITSGFTVVTENGTTTTYTNASTVGNDTTSIFYLFCQSGVSCLSKTRIYYFRLYRDNTLIGEFVPCNYNGVPGMWDSVTNSFFGNNGTGSFTIGNS